MTSFYDRMRASLGYEQPAEANPGLLQQWQTELGEASRLTTQQRMACFGASILFTVLFWTLVRTESYHLRQFCSEGHSLTKTNYEISGILITNGCPYVRFSLRATRSLCSGHCFSEQLLGSAVCNAPVLAECMVFSRTLLVHKSYHIHILLSI
jgi:hypothetical protein